MPKRYWINQWINDGPKTAANLQKEAGSSNGTVFLHQGEEHGSKDINDGSKKAANVHEEAGSSNGTVFLHQGEAQDVDVEAFCSQESSFVVDSKVQAITQRPAKSPARRPLSPGKATTLTIVKVHCCWALHGMQCPL